MRIIVYGVGAIGGTVAAALAQAGLPVVGIARGAQLAAISAHGLHFRTPETTLSVKFPCVSDPTEIDLGPTDVILLTMKTQDTLVALERLRAAGSTGQAIFCVQNGVANERLALRRFPEVHGVMVMMPAAFTTAGEVSAFSSPRYGIFEIGRYPVGADAQDEALASALEKAGIAAFVTADVMASKYGKLLMNLRNILEAALGVGVDTSGPYAVLRREAEAVLKAAGITWRDVGASDPRRERLMQIRSIAGVPQSGSSSTQSLSRGTGSIETDYLNGEIVLLGRQMGVPVPANAYCVELSARLVRDGMKPGTVSLAEIEAGLADALSKLS